MSARRPPRDRTSALAATARAVRDELRCVNFAGREVTLAEGVTVWLATSALAACPGGAPRSRVVDAATLLGIGALGLADDLIEPRRRRAGEQVAKGLRGHLGALREGRLTTGGTKALGIPLLCLAASAVAAQERDGSPGRRAVRVLADAALAAGAANLANLLDLRPGRALKTVLLPAAVLSAPRDRSARADSSVPADSSARADRSAQANSGARLARAVLLPGLLALPVDLRERGMLGDCGANVLGAACGLALARRGTLPVRLLALGVVLALTIASEQISFSAVIERTPALRALDQLGRRERGSR